MTNAQNLRTLLNSIEMLMLPRASPHMVFIRPNPLVALVAPFQVEEEDIGLLIHPRYITLFTYSLVRTWSCRLQASSGSWKEVLITWLWGYDALRSVRERKHIHQPCTTYTSRG